MPTKKISRKSEPDATVYITAPQVLQRYGGVSHMWLERILQRDQNFPRPHKFGRLRFFKIDDLIGSKHNDGIALAAEFGWDHRRALYRG